MPSFLRLLRRALERAGLSRAPASLREDPDYAHIDAGAFSYGRPLIIGHDGSPETAVSIGKFCSIADGVRILLRVNHPLDAPSTFPVDVILARADPRSYARSRGPVRIGHDVWIGQDAVIMGGVTLGNGAVVGAKAVVTRDVPPYGIVAGNPARLVRSRFPDAIIAQLEAAQWWDWPVERIREHAHLLTHGPIEEFLRLAAKVGPDSR